MTVLKGVSEHGQAEREEADDWHQQARQACLEEEEAMSGDWHQWAAQACLEEEEAMLRRMTTGIKEEAQVGRMTAAHLAV
jgi:hypothetical protein